MGEYLSAVKICPDFFDGHRWIFVVRCSDDKHWDCAPNKTFLVLSFIILHKYFQFFYCSKKSWVLCGTVVHWKSSTVLRCNLHLRWYFVSLILYFSVKEEIRSGIFRAALKVWKYGRVVARTNSSGRGLMALSEATVNPAPKPPSPANSLGQEDKWKGKQTNSLEKEKHMVKQFWHHICILL